MLTSIWLHSVAGLVTAVYGYKFLRSLGWRKGIVMGLTRELMAKGKGNTFVTLMLPVVGIIEFALGSVTQSLSAVAFGTKDKHVASKTEAAKISTAIERLTNPATAPTVKMKRPASQSDVELLIDMMVELETKMWKSHDNIMTMLHPIVLRNRDRQLELSPAHTQSVADAVTEGFKGPIVGFKSPYNKPHDIKRKEDNRARRELRHEVDWRKLNIPYIS